jgi:molecular chaperone DnaK (HSP70)
MEPRYVIGIDLGTTNSALSYAETSRMPIRSPCPRSSCWAFRSW